MARAKSRSLAPLLAMVVAMALAGLAWSFSSSTTIRDGFGPTPSAPVVIAPAPERAAPADRHADRTPPPADGTAAPDAHEPPRLSADPLVDLRRRALVIPVEGVTARDLRSSFSERRGEDRTHEALDILAPRNAPVLAVEDGAIAKLFLSKAGGTTIYQFDPTERFVYYYAHLERYAPGLAEGDRVRRGETIGYVGTSGNAPPGTPHLHFAIFKVGEEKRWWEGTPIDPYAVWGG